MIVHCMLMVLNEKYVLIVSQKNRTFLEDWANFGNCQGLLSPRGIYDVYDLLKDVFFFSQNISEPLE